MRLAQCHNFNRFREVARRRLPESVFNLRDGAVDVETTLRRNNAGIDNVDWLPQVLHCDQKVDLLASMMCLKLTLPFHLLFNTLVWVFHDLLRQLVSLQGWRPEPDQGHGVERMLGKMNDKLLGDMRVMGPAHAADLSREHLRFQLTANHLPGAIAPFRELLR